MTETKHTLGPDSLVQSDVPKGTITGHEMSSAIYGGVVHDYKVYVPAQYR